jgi:hypothetical protein
VQNDPPERVGALLDRAVHDRDGALLGRVAGIITETDAQGRERVVALVVTRRPWGRLLGYEHDEHTGPWLLQWLARRLLRRDVRRVAWADTDLSRDEPATQ